MPYEADGKLVEIYPIKTRGASFQVREFVVEMASGKFSEYIKFQATGDKTTVLDDFRKGDLVRVTFDLRGRPWTGNDGTTQYFTNLNAWRIEPANNHTAPANQQREEQFGKDSGMPEDDLPF